LQKPLRSQSISILPLQKLLRSQNTQHSPPSIRLLQVIEPLKNSSADILRMTFAFIDPHPIDLISKKGPSERIWYWINLYKKDEDDVKKKNL
jgi:hypothetical protein